MTSRCNQVSTVIGGTGVTSSLLSTVLAVTYYTSYPLTILSGAAAIAGLVGCWYIRKYSQLESVNKINKDIGNDANQVEKTAEKVSAAVEIEKGVGTELEDDEKKIGVDLGTLQALNQQLAHSQTLITSLEREKKGLKSDNERLQKELSSFHDLNQTLASEIEVLKKQLSSSSSPLEIRIDSSFQRELKEAEQASARFQQVLRSSPPPSTQGNS